jgi:hypothetical protein
LTQGVRLARRQLRLFGAALVAANLLLPAGLILYAQAVGRDYAGLFWGEYNAVTWFASVQLLLVALVAYANHEAAGVLQRLGLGDPSRRRWVWLVFAAGFVFLSLDERFEFHEYLRDEVLRPRDLFVVPFLRKSDVAMYGYLGVGLLLGWLLLDELRARRVSLGLFAGGVVVAAASVLIDTLDKSLTRQLPFPDFWTSAFEEVGELWAQLLFGLSFLVLLDDRLRRLGDRGAPGP